MIRALAGLASLVAIVATAPAHAQSRSVVLPPPPASVAPEPGFVVDPAEMAEARAIIAIMFPPEQRDAMIRSMMQQIVDQLGQAAPADVAAAGDSGLAAILTRFRDNVVATVMPTARAHLPNILEASAVAYANEFSLAELKDIRAFAESPVGRHYLSRANALLGDPAVAAANTAYFADLSELARTKREELQAEVAEYLAAHPDVAERIVATPGGD